MIDTYLTSAEDLQSCMSRSGFSIRHLADAVERSLRRDHRKGDPEPTCSSGTIGHLHSGARRTCRLDRARAIETILGVEPQTLFRTRSGGSKPIETETSATMESDIKNYGFTGTPVPASEDVSPGSEGWAKGGVSASRVASIMGEGWSSKFDVWHVMAGNLPYDSLESPVQRRGRLLEPGVVAFFAENHPEFEIVTTGTWRGENPKHMATPDRILLGKAGNGLLEVKTARVDDASWGLDGSDQVPRPYFIQTQWQMHVLGAEWTALPVLKPYLEFGEYFIERDQSAIDQMVEVVDEFLDTLPGRPNFALPQIDGHEATYEAIRKLNPKIQDGDIVIDPAVAQRFIDSRAALEKAEEEHRRWKGEVADKLGPFKNAVVPVGDGFAKVASRRSGRNGGVPYMQAASTLPNLSTEKESA